MSHSAGNLLLWYLLIGIIKSTFSGKEENQLDATMTAY
jgi:hypothetical protein